MGVETYQAPRRAQPQCVTVSRGVPASVRIALGVLAVLIVCAFVAATHPARAQDVAGRPAVATPDLTGFWALRFDSRSTPAATLVAGLGSKQIQQHQAADRHAVRWCQPVGMPALMDSSSPIGIVQGTHEVTLSTDVPSAPRHLYLNRKRPDESVFEPTTNGFSVAHWEQDVLVVQTTGFNDKGETLIPGGGFRTAGSTLTERFQLLRNGRELQVSSTWTDPAVYAKPHTYAYRYYRLPPSFHFGESFCDSNDASRASFLDGASGAAPATGAH